MDKKIYMSDIIALVPPFSQYVEDTFRGHEPKLDALESNLRTDTYLGWSDAFNKRMKVMPINTWICTDTLVGVFAYYFDGNFVALSFQSARKSDTFFHWVSKAEALSVREFIRSLSDENEPLEITLLDPDNEVSSDWLRKVN